VRNTARSEARIAGVQLPAGFSDLEDRLALHHIKPLFRVRVKMERGSAFQQVFVLNDSRASVFAKTGPLQRALRRCEGFKASGGEKCGCGPLNWFSDRHEKKRPACCEGSFATVQREVGETEK
jgi:hypothetical protein